MPIINTLWNLHHFGWWLHIWISRMDRDNQRGPSWNDPTGCQSPPGFAYLTPRLPKPVPADGCFLQKPSTPRHFAMTLPPALGSTARHIHAYSHGDLYPESLAAVANFRYHFRFPSPHTSACASFSSLL